MITYSKILPSSHQDEKENAKHDVTDVTEDIVELTEHSEGMSAVEVVITNVFISRHIQYLQTNDSTYMN